MTNPFVGKYISVEEFEKMGCKLREGDVVIVETFYDNKAVEIVRKDIDGTLWASSSSDWVIPENQIVAVKLQVEKGSK